MQYIININNLVGLVCGVKRHFQEEFEDTKGLIRIDEGPKTHWPKEKGQRTIYKTYT